MEADPSALPWAIENNEETETLSLFNSAFAGTLCVEAETRRTILLVEDTDSAILMIKDYLETVGYRVEVARNGTEGIARAIALRPDLILVDVQMAGMDGLEAAHRIRREAALQTIPILALTALAMNRDREKCIEACMNDYISKPVVLRELARIVETHLSDPGTGPGG